MDLVSIPQGPINTKWQLTKLLYENVSIPQGPINTYSKNRTNDN